MSIIVNRGFILIEIIISVMLLSFAGIALLKVNSNQKKLYSIAKNKLEISKKMSILINQHSIDLHKKKINLYDSIKKKYNLKNDKLIKILKETDIEYTQKYSSMMKLNLDEDKYSLAFLIDKITLYSNTGVSSYITVKK
ncbi:MAG TPA: hypothetical protein EYG93_05075 [Sulfurospirillum arcachonense]|nr:hypothetical protein [Sulfurospirillum arcachonense]